MFNKICQIASLLSLLLSGSMAAFGFVAIRYMQSPEFERDLKNTVNAIQEQSSVELLAIGIGHDVTRYYKKAVKITDVQDLGDVMINQLSDLFSGKKTRH